jgi:hypothetical protein
MLHCETDVKRLKTVTSWSIFHRISIIILRFLLLYLMLHVGCVTCLIVLTLIECNLQILRWFLDLCIVLCIKPKKEHVIKTGSVSIIKWQVEEASAEPGVTDGAVRYWFSDWDSSVAPSVRPKHIHLPTFSPKDMNGSSSETLCCFLNMRW